MKLKNIKGYTNALIFTTVLLSIMAAQFPQFAVSMFLTSLLALAGIIVLHWKYWRCPKCHHWLGMNLNITHCPRCRKKIDFEK